MVQLFSISNGVASAVFKQPLQPLRKWQHSHVDTVVSAIFKQNAAFVRKQPKFGPFSNNVSSLRFWALFRPFSNNLQCLLENGRNFGRFPTMSSL